MKRSKILVSALAAMVVATALAGCGKKTEPTSNTTNPAKESKKIVVWSHLNQEEIDAIKPIAQEWAKNTGNTVEVLKDESDFNAFATAASSSKAADIMYGLPHDNLGGFIKAGVVAEVPAGIVTKDKYNDNAVNAVSQNGKIYAVPIASESVALFYNPDKVKEVPKTLDELIAQGKTLGFKYEAKNLYHSFAFINGFGGYIFKDNNGVLDVKDIGLGNEGAVKAYQAFETFAKELGMKSSVDSGAAAKEFQAGKTAFYISGPWDVEGMKTANAKFKVAPIPTINGKPSAPFLGIQSAFVNSKSKNQAEAWDLMKYLAERTEKPIWDKGHRLPVLKASKIADEIAKSDYAGFGEQVKTAYPMPNVVEMGAAWKVNDSLPVLLDGKMDAKAFAEKVVKDIKAQLETQAK